MFIKLFEEIAELKQRASVLEARTVPPITFGGSPIRDRVAGPLTEEQRIALADRLTNRMQLIADVESAHGIGTVQQEGSDGRQRTS
jgi:hypothetical protein